MPWCCPASPHYVRSGPRRAEALVARDRRREHVDHHAAARSRPSATSSAGPTAARRPDREVGRLEEPGEAVDQDQARDSSGCAAAKGIARIPPPMFAISAAVPSRPWSRTAGMSAMNSSSVGSEEVGIGSDRPVPRLSNMIRRPNEARRSRSSASGGTSHWASRWPNHWSSRRRSGGPPPRPGTQGEVAQAGVPGLGNHRP